MKSDPISLSGKVILVTGATGAIGAVTARRLAGAGAHLVLSDALPAADDRVRELVAAVGQDDCYITCDISAEAQVRAAVQFALDRHDRLDGAANIAGVVGPGLPAQDYPEREFRQVVDVNLIGTWLCVKHELSAMLPSRRGAIVNVASIAGHNGEVHRAPYVASKAGVIGLTKVAAIEAAAHGVRVNAISPGPVDTAQFHANVGAPGSARYQRVIEGIPSGRLGSAINIADAISWLLSDASAFVVGHELIADGGLLAEGLAAPRLVEAPTS
jgi:NAD(P)-dependent dehydrogenase (short-subunit alcohol dehydrogenase family)